jgi:hypothetical protein
MPRKTARSGSQTPLGRSEMSRALHPLASGLPASSENAYHPRQFRVHLGNPGLAWTVAQIAEGGLLDGPTGASTDGVRIRGQIDSAA